MTSRRDQNSRALLTVEAAAERLSTSPRFIRRLIAGRRIEFVKVGRHVRISESALHDFIGVSATRGNCRQVGTRFGLDHFEVVTDMQGPLIDNPHDDRSPACDPEGAFKH